jgi:nucleolar protein 6
MGKSSSKKRERTDEDVADTHDAKPVVKKSKLDSTGKAEVTKKSARVKEAEPETVASKDVEAAAESDEPAPAPAQVAPSNPSPSTAEPANGADSADKKTKEKKDKKDKKDKKTKPAPSTTDEPSPEGEEATTTTTTTGTENGGPEKPNRFICFVGNLPYTATAESVRAHFATLQPTSVRLLTQRDDPSKSRGIAFVEFGRYDHMKTCLKKFHHTEFVDENDKKSKGPPRRINVELTYVLTTKHRHTQPMEQSNE